LSAPDAPPRGTNVDDQQSKKNRGRDGRLEMRPHEAVGASQPTTQRARTARRFAVAAASVSSTATSSARRPGSSAAETDDLLAVAPRRGQGYAPSIEHALEVRLREHVGLGPPGAIAPSRRYAAASHRRVPPLVDVGGLGDARRLVGDTDRLEDAADLMVKCTARGSGYGCGHFSNTPRATRVAEQDASVCPTGPYPTIATS